MKKCKQGQYYCYTDKKCKKIPMGWHVARGGYIEKDDGESETKKNGNGNGSSNGNGNGNGSTNGNGNGSANGNGVGGGAVSEALRSSILSDRRTMKSISDNDKKNKEQDARMKYGKNWKKFTSDVDSAKNRLRKGEVKKFNKQTGKWESNKD